MRHRDNRKMNAEQKTDHPGIRSVIGRKMYRMHNWRLVHFVCGLEASWSLKEKFLLSAVK